MRIFLAILLFFSFRFFPVDADYFTGLNAEFHAKKELDGWLHFTHADFIEEIDPEETEVSGNPPGLGSRYQSSPFGIKLVYEVCYLIDNGFLQVKTGRMYLVLICSLWI